MISAPEISPPVSIETGFSWNNPRARAIVWQVLVVAIVVAMAHARHGKWLLHAGGSSRESGVAVPYDCWMHVQVAVNMKDRVCTFVQQQIGQVAQQLGTSPLPTGIQPGQPLSFRIQLGQANTCVAIDNVKITKANASVP